MSVRSDLADITGQFLVWAKKRELDGQDLPMELADKLAKARPSPCLKLVEELFKGYLSVEEATLCLASWARSAAKANPSQGGVYGPLNKISDRDADLASGVARAWGDAQTNDGINHCKTAWESAGLSAMGAALELETAMGWRASAASASAPGLYARRMQGAGMEALRAPSKPSAWSARAWLKLGADPNIPADSILMGKNQGCSWLQACAKNPSSWLFAAELCAHGAVAAQGDWGGMRQLINCALAQNSNRLGGTAPKERVAAAFSILGAMGFDADSYRGKNGERFDEFALGALWANPSRELVEELALAGVRWSAKCKAKIAPMSFARFKKFTGWKGESVRGAIDAVCERGGGLGPFNESWGHFARVAPGDATQWGDCFARWALQSRWSGGDVVKLALARPGLDQSSAFKAALEAAELDQISLEPPRAPRRKNAL